MKKIKLFTMALAAVIMFASCSKENATNKLDGKPGAKANITISITGNGNGQPDTKALGDPGSTDVNVNDFIVFLFRGDGSRDCEPKGQTGSGEVAIPNATTAAKTVYVVANTGAYTAGSGLFGNIANEDQLKAVVGDLATANQTNTNLWMAGQGVVKFSEEKGKENTATTEVQLGFVTARIELHVIDNRENKDKGDITINEDAIALLFAGKKGHFFGTATEKTTQTEYYSGDDKFPGSAGVTNNSLLPSLKSNLDKQFTKGENKNVAYFYTFGNDGLNKDDAKKAKSTVLTIQSTKTTKVTGQPDKVEQTYHPVTFNGTDAATIVPGTRYEVTITLTGDLNEGGGSGTPDPDVPVVDADVKISVKPAAWLAKIEVKKEFK